MALPTYIGHLETANGSTSSITVSKPAAAATGDLLLLVFSTNTVGVDSLAGWTNLVINVDTGTLRTTIMYRFMQSGDTSWTFAKQTTSGNIVASMLAYRGVSAVSIGSSGTRAASGGTFSLVIPSVTTTVADSLVLSVATERTAATEGAGPSRSQGTLRLWVPHAIAGTSSIETVDIGEIPKTTAGATGTTTLTYANTQVTNGNSYHVILEPAAPANDPPVAAFTYDDNGLEVDVDGTTSTDSDGTITMYSWDWGDGSSDDTGSTQSHTYAAPGTYTITLTVTDDDGATDDQTHNVTVAELPKHFFGSSAPSKVFLGTSPVTAIYLGTSLVQRYGYTVTDLLADTPLYVAHRGLGASYPEQSMTGYDAAVAAGFKALEVSLHVTSDGVFVASHDADPDRVFGQGSTPFSSRTWASVSGFTSATGPILRLEQILDKYAGSHVIFVDDKTNANTSALLSICGSYPNPQQHFIWKGFRGWSPAAATWNAAGYQSWGIYYNAEVGTTGSPHASTSVFTLLGLNWDASSTNWDVATATGKRVLAHVIGNDSDRTTAAGKGATGFMVTNINAMP